jgi:hypothetical protein
MTTPRRSCNRFRGLIGMMKFGPLGLRGVVLMAGDGRRADRFEVTPQSSAPTPGGPTNGPAGAEADDTSLRPGPWSLPLYGLAGYHGGHGGVRGGAEAAVNPSRPSG